MSIFIYTKFNNDLHSLHTSRADSQQINHVWAEPPEPVCTARRRTFPSELEARGASPELGSFPRSSAQTFTGTVSPKHVHVQTFVLLMLRVV